jgi:hypothetical protein
VINVNNPVELQFSQYLGEKTELAYSTQVKTAFKDPQLKISLTKALEDIRDKPGTTRFHYIYTDLFAFNVGPNGGRGLVMRTKDRDFDLVGVTSNHKEYKNLINRLERVDYKYEATRSGQFLSSLKDSFKGPSARVNAELSATPPTNSQQHPHQQSNLGNAPL